MSEANFRGITLSFSKTSAIARFLRLCFVDAELQIGTELAKRKQLPTTTLILSKNQEKTEAIGKSKEHTLFK